MTTAAHTGVEVTMPRLSDSMEEGTILRWMITDGALVTAGQDLVEIETDKATMSYEAEASGVLAIRAAVGETLPIGAVIAYIGSGGDATPAAADRPSGGASLEPPDDPSATDLTKGPQATGAVKGQAAPGRPKASPLARRVAHEHGVDLEQLQGTGPGGRIVRHDVEQGVLGNNMQTLESRSAGSALPPPARANAGADPSGDEPVVAAKGRVETIELSRSQRVIARRMSQSKATAPEFSLTREIDMEAAVALREQLRARPTGPQSTPSYNDMIVKACALALREFPGANAAYRDGRFEQFGRINIGVAVAVDESLVVPTVMDADIKSLGEIARTTRDFAQRARDGTVTPGELSGGTFSVSNLGMYGIDSFTAVLNPPQAAILAVGALRERPVVVDGAIAVRHVLQVTLTCDHRILYGAQAAALLGRVAEFLADPFALLL